MCKLNAVNHPSKHDWALPHYFEKTPWPFVMESWRISDRKKNMCLLVVSKWSLPDRIVQSVPNLTRSTDGSTVMIVLAGTDSQSVDKTSIFSWWKLVFATSGQNPPVACCSTSVGDTMLYLFYRRCRWAMSYFYFLLSLYIKWYIQ
jgi:hypothetical protein